MNEAEFKVGQHVVKFKGEYTGPGIVRAVTELPDGRLRYLVGHVIRGGEGEFLHIYAPNQLVHDDDYQEETSDDDGPNYEADGDKSE